MIFLFVVYAVSCLGLLAAGVVEQRRHHQYLRSIPHRVVVNGIRGKSSITRLCAGALRHGGLGTVAKTTGTAARFIAPDASEEPVHRKFDIANVVEQIGIVRRAAAFRPDVLVIECMAVLPELQEINQQKLVQATICVISNVREDHVAEMGPTLSDIARSLSRSMPTRGICVTAECEQIDVLRREAERRGTVLVQVDPDTVTDDEIEQFPWITFKDNVAVALEVARLHGIDRATALAGMVAAPPDPGVVRVERHQVGMGTMSFANIFAANDPASTRMNIMMLAERRLLPGPLTMIINCRADRVERNAQMGALSSELIGEGDLDVQRIVLIGEQTHSARGAVADELRDRVTDHGGAFVLSEVLSACPVDADGDFAVVAVGNIHGQGELLLEQIHALPSTARTPVLAHEKEDIET